LQCRPKKSRAKYQRISLASCTNHSDHPRENGNITPSPELDAAPSLVSRIADLQSSSLPKAKQFSLKESSQGSTLETPSNSKYGTPNATRLEEETMCASL
jgi:hypothetical protein